MWPSGGFMRNQGLFRALSIGLLALLVSACGGGGGNPSAFVPDDGDPDTSGGQTVQSLVLLASSPQLSSSAATAANGVTLTAIARDASQNVVQGATIAFSTSDSASIAVLTAVTDTNGQAQAVVTTGGDPTNRRIELRASARNVSADVSIDVVGTALSISGPETVQVGVSTEYTALLVDSEGVGISGQVLAVTTDPENSISASSLTTDAAGQASFTLTATKPDSFVRVAALGLSASQPVAVVTDSFTFSSIADQALLPINLQQPISIRWVQGAGQTPVPDGTTVVFSSTRGTLTSREATTLGGIATVSIISAQSGTATITASSPALTMPTVSTTVQFVASQAASVSVQADPSVIGTNQSSNIDAIVRDASNNLVANKVVEFNLTDNTGGFLSASSARTNNLGIARITYSSSSVTSADNGIRITAVARNEDSSSVSNFVRLTVGSRALRILLGTGNEIFEPNETTYQFPYSAIVTDSAGNPAPDASFSLRVLPSRYFKGYYIAGSLTWFSFVTASCLNEDVNNNGILDPLEDTSGDGVLTPGNVASVPTSLALDPVDGSVQFNITYPQDRGNWAQVILSATAAVAGTETVERSTFILPISADDAALDQSPPGKIYDELAVGIDANGDGILSGRFIGSPYGISSSCDDSN